MKKIYIIITALIFSTHAAMADVSDHETWSLICDQVHYDSGYYIYCSDLDITVSDIKSNCGVSYSNIRIVGNSKSYTYDGDYVCDGFYVCPYAEMGYTSPGWLAYTAPSSTVTGGYCTSDMKAKYRENACGETRSGAESGYYNDVMLATVYETCSGATHCGPGYYKSGSTCIVCPAGTYKSGITTETSCTTCPALSSVAGAAVGTAATAHDDITDCYIPANTNISDTIGTYIFTNNCNYSY